MSSDRVCRKSVAVALGDNHAFQKPDPETAYKACLKSRVNIPKDPESNHLYLVGNRLDALLSHSVATHGSSSYRMKVQHSNFSNFQ